MNRVGELESFFIILHVAKLIPSIVIIVYRDVLVKQIKCIFLILPFRANEVLNWQVSIHIGDTHLNVFDPVGTALAMKLTCSS